jgi:hypothetical protein
MTSPSASICSSAWAKAAASPVTRSPFAVRTVEAVALADRAVPEPGEVPPFSPRN